MLLHLMAGSKEDAETVTAFFEDRRRGAQRPAAGDLGRRPRHHQGDRGVLPRAARQRRQGAGGYPAGLQGARAGGPTRLRAAPLHELAAGIVADYGREQERGVACFMDDFEACIAHLRFPVTHRRGDPNHEFA